jgi:hypothetical protein
MNPPRGSRSKLWRFGTQRLGVTSNTVLAAFLIVVGLAVLAMLSNLTCSSPKTITPPPRTRPASTPTSVPTRTAPSTPVPTLLPPVTLERPENDSRFYLGSEVTICWSSPRALQEGEYYQLRVKGQNPSLYSSLFYYAEDRFTLPALSAGEYNWAVAIVRSAGPDEYLPVGEESEWRSFEILPPPIVHTISPTSTVRGTGATVVVSGENLTRSLALIIGVPLEATVVNSSTITATVPITLEVGEYPVIVKDSVGQGESYASFIVGEPPTPVPTAPSPVSSPWNPTLPVPTALPGYNPNVACVINPCAPAPQLIDPQNGTEFILNSSIELRWEWTYCLPPGWKFAIQISETSPHSYRYEDNPKLISCEDGKAVGRYRLPEDSRFRTTSGTYYWNIAVARSVGGGWERLSEYSETRWFVVKPGKPNGSCPVPPCE